MQTKGVKIKSIILLLISTFLLALTPQEIEKQIEEIEKLPLQERIKKMNELKKELMKLNAKMREEIIKDIAKEKNIENQESVDKEEKIEKVIVKKERPEK